MDSPTAAGDDTSWVLELESALFTDCDLNTVRKICKGKPVPDNLRSEFWQVCLGVKGKNNTEVWDEIYDLREQSLIREECQKLVDRLGNEEDDKVSVVSDLESVITKYCKSTSYSFQKDNGWLELLEPLLSLKLLREQLYNCFSAIQSTFIPRNCHKNGQPFHLFRLLLLYHDPELCSFLDTKKITPDQYAIKWFTTLFSASCDLKVIQVMWDIYFQMADPYFIFFLALGILVNSREELMVKEDSRQNIIELLVNVPCALEQNDVEDFCMIAQYYASRTPQSFSKEYHSLIFGDKQQTGDINLSQALCLPVAVHELVLNNRLDIDKCSSVHYFVVDCRPAEQYNSGHLSTAFHLDANLMLQEPLAFNTAVEALFTARQQAISAGSVAAGEHLCFMGSGRNDEDQYVHMVVASFLQKHLHFVSLALGGYAALHEFLSEDSSSSLVHHNPKACIVCNPSQSKQMLEDGDEEDISFLDKLASAVRSRTVGVREKLVEYIKNPQQPVERHVSSTDKVGKRYRQKDHPVFSIEDSSDVTLQEFSPFASPDEEPEEINLNNWLKKSDVIGHFKCSELKDTGHLFPSVLLVTETHLYVLREIPLNKGYVSIVAQRPLDSIVKITSKRRHPELITFKYGSLGGINGEMKVTAIDKLLIPQAGDATHLIKYQVIKILDNNADS